MSKDLTKAGRYFEIIRKPVITEKTDKTQNDHNCYVFEVAPDATKPEIKDSVEFVFDVKVRAVNVLNSKGKKKLFRGRPGYRKDRKKAYVYLEKGSSIMINQG